MTDEWGIDRLDLPAYLDRIGCAASDDLATLHRAHVAAVPFENLDVVLGRGIDPDLAAVADKLVTRRRGGYCHEHATLFGAALERLGYPVLRLLARVGGDGVVPTPRTHMLLAVEADGQRWMADVGFGSGVLTPIPWRPDATTRRRGRGRAARGLPDRAHRRGRGGGSVALNPARRSTRWMSSSRS